MNDTLRGLLYVFLLICIPYMSVFVKMGMTALINAGAAYVKDVRIQRLLREVGNAVADAVAAMNQKYVDDLKKNGEFKEEQQKEILQRAISAALKSLSDDAQEYLKTTYGDTTAYLETRIEAQINENKRVAQKQTAET